MTTESTEPSSSTFSLPLPDSLDDFPVVVHFFRDTVDEDGDEIREDVYYQQPKYCYRFVYMRLNGTIQKIRCSRCNSPIEFTDNYCRHCGGQCLGNEYKKQKGTEETNKWFLERY